MVLISNIQKYSVHDGEGIRTTIFFKGCPLRCKWCHNPETFSFKKELSHNFESCNNCGLCVNACKNNCISFVNDVIKNDYTNCNNCGDCVRTCVKNSRKIFGEELSVKKIINEVEKDLMFYETSGGGVTLSGGEVLAQDMDFILELLKSLKLRGYHVLIDTSGHTDYKNIQMIINLVDGFLYDIKLINDEKHKKYIGMSNNLILENLKKLSDDGGKIHIRIPVIGGVNSDENSMNEIVSFLLENKINVSFITLTPYHNTAKSKYLWLEKENYLGEFYVPKEEELLQYKEIFRKNNFNVNI